MGATHQLKCPAISTAGSKGLWSEVADAVALDLIEANGNVHKHGDQGGSFDCGIPAIDVMGGVGFGDSKCLGFFQSFVETEALLHFAEDHVGSRVEDSVKALQVDGGQLVEEGEDGNSVHDCGFEKEALAFFGGQVAEVAPGVNDGTFVGADGVGSVLKGGADVVNRGLTVVDI